MGVTIMLGTIMTEKCNYVCSFIFQGKKVFFFRFSPQDIWSQDTLHALKLKFIWIPRAFVYVGYV